MPNSVAFVALFSWPLVVFVLFRTTPRTVALIWSILGGYLLLPYGVAVDLPMLPPIDKALVPAVSAALMSLLLSRPRDSAVALEGDAAEGQHKTSASTKARRPSSQISRAATLQLEPRAVRSSRGPWVDQVLILLMVLVPFLTVMQNAEPSLAGTHWLPGLQIYDAFSMSLAAATSILPYLLGRRFLSSAYQHVLLLKGLCIAGLTYSLPALFEVRMSPQLNRWTYGFLSQSFDQAVRDGGFRPVVFLQHGLWLAIFLAFALLAGIVLSRLEARKGLWVLATVWLLGTLVLCKSIGALAIALLLAPVALLMSVRAQMVLACAIAVIILTYPMLRGASIIPVDQILELANATNPERGKSLEFRLRNEDILLAHASQMPLAGWGGWGRSRVFDQVTGQDISVTDGMWIITIGVSGWLGYVAQFGLLTVPIFVLVRRQRQLDVTLATSGLCLILAANLIDLIPNATLTPVTWLIAGALMGRTSQQAYATTTGRAMPNAGRALSVSRSEDAVKGHRS